MLLVLRSLGREELVIAHHPYFSTCIRRKKLAFGKDESQIDALGGPHTTTHLDSSDFVPHSFLDILPLFLLTEASQQAVDCRAILVIAPVAYKGNTLRSTCTYYPDITYTRTFAGTPTLVKLPSHAQV